MGAVPVIALIVIGRQGNGKERLRCGFWMVGISLSNTRNPHCFDTMGKAFLL